MVETWKWKPAWNPGGRLARRFPRAFTGGDECLKRKRPSKTGLNSNDAVQMMQLSAGWKLETGTPNWNPVASESLR